MHIIAIHMGIYYWLFSYLYDILLSQMLFVIQWIISDISYNQHNHIIIVYQKINLQCVKKHPSLFIWNVSPIWSDISRKFLLDPRVSVRPSVRWQQAGTGSEQLSYHFELNWLGGKEGGLTGGGSGSVMERQDVVLLLSSARCISHQSIRNSEVKKLE